MTTGRIADIRNYGSIVEVIVDCGRTLRDARSRHAMDGARHGVARGDHRMFAHVIEAEGGQISGRRCETDGESLRLL